MDRLYSAAPDGYCGDDDNGQTSAWYVFSALGFYPVCPASDTYAIGAPYFPQMQINLENGKAIRILTENCVDGCGDCCRDCTSPCVITSTTINPKITVHGENHK